MFVSFVLQMEPQIKFLPGCRRVYFGEDSTTTEARQCAARSRHIPEGQVLLTLEVTLRVCVGRIA